MRQSFLFKILALLLAFGLIAAACGDDDDDTAAGDDTAASDDGGSDDGASDDGTTPAGDCDEADQGPIKIGVLGQLQFFPGIEEGAKARINRVNEAGGVCGRMFEYVKGIDDNSDAQANLDGAKDLVDNEGVYAIVATSAQLLPQTTDYLAENEIPFSGWGFMPGFCEPNKWGFGFNGCLSGFGFGIPGAKASLAVSDPNVPLLDGNEDFSLVVFNSDDTAGESGSTLYNYIWGDRILAEDFVPVGGTVTDFSPYINLVLDNEPDVVVVSTDFATAIGLKAAILAAGYEGPVIDYVTYVPGLLQDAGTAAALEGGYSNTQFPAQEEGKAATQQIAADLEAIGEAAFVTQGASIGYWGMDTLVQLIEAAAAAGSTDKATFDQVANVDGVDIDSGLDGGLCPFNSLDAHLQPVPGAGIVQVVGGEYVVAVEFGCWNLFEEG